MNEESVYSLNDEIYETELDTVINDIYWDKLPTYEEFCEYEIFVGTPSKVKFNATRLFDLVYDDVNKQAYNFGGEYADDFDISNKQREELKQFLDLWVDTIPTSFYRVHDGETIKLNDILLEDDLKSYYKDLVEYFK